MTDAKTIIDLHLRIQVDDAKRLIEFARERVSQVYAVEDLDELVAGNETLLERALIEVLVFSNMNPSPDEYGVAIDVVRAKTSVWEPR